MGSKFDTTHTEATNARTQKPYRAPTEFHVSIDQILQYENYSPFCFTLIFVHTEKVIDIIRCVGSAGALYTQN